MKNIVPNILITAAIIFFISPVYAATIVGVVKYDGAAPKFKEIKMDADPLCVEKHTSAVYPQTLVLGEGNTMANVFVHVKSGLPSQAHTAPTEPVVLDQKGCFYEPHVFGVMVGQPVKILNPDGTLHNVHAMSKINPEFNLAMPKFRTETTKVFDKPEFMFAFKCDVHPWMLAWGSVMSHPFFSTTKQDGKFTIDNLPVGTYEIEAWHEKLGTQKASVTLADGEAKEIGFTFSKPSSGE
ncbi:MAG: hypothetical protein A2705_00960 [Omnitrophica WOR_2 bacterium RIFCSPHIGHO2_01_FULL_52_10]|nr:MAG: hypothetical protein A2705_00960 [Omnitrophica WOR_2 bacterium RIFCSPHIGHO2_01_FULL_52_10]